MITAEIKVNGIPLAQIYIRRLAEIPPNQAGESVYRVEYYEPEKGLTTASVTHGASGTVVSLLEKVMQTIQAKFQANARAAVQANAQNLPQPRKQ